jgi:hypothetical protein
MPNNLDRKIRLLPPFPRTPHLPYNPNRTEDDLVAVDTEAAVVFSSPHVYVEEKVDGASVGLYMDDEDNPVIRNSEHILGKGYVKKNTPAKLQFRSLWNFFYDNREKFEELRHLGLSLYGEWMVMQHGLEYDKLPSLLIAYDLFEQDTQKFIDPLKARTILAKCGFSLTPIIHVGAVPSYSHLEQWSQRPTPLSTKGNAEGVYIKVSDGDYITHRFKMVRPDFKQGGLFSEKDLIRNKVLK